ncbi:uncharacterized protein LOC118463476 [Anopheles albimanus]|uniref:Kazal-like domain-containing protein n=1 Tax=Anopheles albimanus TaxID=7167 RepID=A0A182FI46_ANOAL|nr:uncharacterized protein LOC118463476 [Anopheles albimanus]
MARQSGVLVLGVLVAAGLLVLLALAVPADANSVAGLQRFRRQSPWLHRTPTTFKKFARLQHPGVAGSHRLQAIATNTVVPYESSKETTTSRPTEGPEATRPATRSRAFYNCMSGCLTLSQYNPVCGTDHTTYHNEYKLECANRCGASPRVSIRKSGIC